MIIFNNARSCLKNTEFTCAFVVRFSFLSLMKYWISSSGRCFRALWTCLPYKIIQVAAVQPAIAIARLPFPPAILLKLGAISCLSAEEEQLHYSRFLNVFYLIHFRLPPLLHSTLDPERTLDSCNSAITFLGICSLLCFTSHLFLLLESVIRWNYYSSLRHTLAASLSLTSCSIHYNTITKSDQTRPGGSDTALVVQSGPKTPNPTSTLVGFLFTSLLLLPIRYTCGESISHNIRFYQSVVQSTGTSGKSPRGREVGLWSHFARI